MVMSSVLCWGSVYAEGWAGQFQQRANFTQRVSSREATVVRCYRSTSSADLDLTLSDARRSVKLTVATRLHIQSGPPYLTPCMLILSVEAMFVPGKIHSLSVSKYLPVMWLV